MIVDVKSCVQLAGHVAWRWMSVCPAGKEMVSSLGEAMVIVIVAASFALGVFT